jgi:CRP-like cAMP-binding protein
VNAHRASLFLRKLPQRRPHVEAAHRRRLLLALAQTEQRSVAMTQDDLARALAVGRTSVNQVCKELRADNLISYRRRLIRINNIEV